MKKSTLIFFTALTGIMLFLSPPVHARGTYYIREEAEKACPYSYGNNLSTCLNSSNQAAYYTCYKYRCSTEQDGEREVYDFDTLAQCQCVYHYVCVYSASSGYDCTRPCYFNGSSYAYTYKNSGCKVPCPENCTTCSSGVCSVCRSGYYLSDDNTCQKEKSCTSNCSDCNKTTGVCSVCRSGYYLSDDNTCQKEKSCTSNCSDCNKTTGVCSVCRSGYYLSGNGCISCPKNATCDGKSINCNDGYTETNGICKPQETVYSCPSHMKLSADNCCCVNK